MSTVVYQYPNCSTCRKALKWLDARSIEYRAIDIVAEPPSPAVLGRVLQRHFTRHPEGRSGAELRKLFNVSGQSYRQGDWKQRVATIGRAEALAALAADGKLIKRPLLLADDVALIGFDPDAWAAALT